MSKTEANRLRTNLDNRSISFEVEHVRPLVGIDVNGDHMVNRSEFNSAYPDKTYGNYVTTCGGFTIVRLYKNNELLVQGKGNFNPKENFCKNTGFVRAIFNAGSKLGINFNSN